MNNMRSVKIWFGLLVLNLIVNFISSVNPSPILKLTRMINNSSSPARLQYWEFKWLPFPEYVSSESDSSSRLKKRSTFLLLPMVTDIVNYSAKYIDEKTKMG